MNAYGSPRFNKPILQQELAYFGTDVFCKPTFLDIRSLLSSTFQCLINNDEFILSLYLNDALSMENAAIERLQTRIKQTRLQDSKVQLQRHLEETRQQQVRLKQLISGLGGKATRDKGRLPIPSSSKSIENLIKKHRTNAEAELKGAKEDAIVESAEIVLYDTLIQLAQKAATVGGGVDAIPILIQNLDEEKAMLDWIRANTPVFITQLWPSIAASVVGIEGGETISAEHRI